jgi:hypothetical protein
MLPPVKSFKKDKLLWWSGTSFLSELKGTSKKLPELLVFLDRWVTDPSHTETDERFVEVSENLNQRHLDPR